jgi:hypothetical protein
MAKMDDFDSTVIHGALFYMRALQMGPDEAREDLTRELRRSSTPETGDE